MQLQGRGGRCRSLFNGSSRVRTQARLPGLVVRASGQTVPVTVTVKKKVELGEKIHLVGNQPFLGEWNPTQGPSLKWNEGHNWQATLQVPVGVDVCFKAVRVKEDGNSEWEGGGDRSFKALGPDFGLDISCNWDETGNTKIKAVPLDGSSGSKTPSSSRNRNGNGNGNGNQRGLATSSLSSMEEDARATSAWVGGGPQFVRSRLDQGSHQGTWRTEGLQGVELELVQGDQKKSDWLGKLGLMKSLLVDKPEMMRPHMAELAACYVYATWINTGAIRCVETGGHHRPNHHANAALQMFRSLEWTIGDAAMGNGGDWPAEARMLAARRMATRLPSISGEFRASVPLTRIRDIAHRNDIPSELKQEIKHTLQNKIHRSAGPEDLVATEAMLERITAPGANYSGDFVEQFKIFTRELREFFNASGLVELLEQTHSSLEDQHKAVVNQFREAMARLDSQKENPNMDDLMTALFMGTQARGFFISGLSAGLRNDVGDDVLAMRQRWRLAEIRIEDYIFVLLARLIGQLENSGGAAMMANPNSTGAWRAAAGALVQGLRQLGLSGYATKELLVLENEVESWVAGFTKGGASAQKEGALRGKACVERVQRLASQYSDVVMSIYAEPSRRLGNALGVEEHMASIFGESEVRASVAFQVSRLAGLLSKGLRAVANMDAWDGLVTGDAVGRLVSVDSISPEAMEQACKGHNDDVILLARQASGDEEVGSLGPRLRGVVLCQELPHLSHLGVRARQEQCTFATCDDPDYVATKIKPLVGRTVRFSVNADSVALTESQGGNGAAPAPAAVAKTSNGNGNGKAHAGRAGQAGSQSMASTQKANRLLLTPLEEATVDTCGSKAAKCGDLERLASGAGKSLFVCPPGAVLPFGSMELALEQSDCMKEYQASLSALEDASLTGSALDAECEKIAGVIRRARLPGPLLDAVASSFSNGALLAVRSSANVEDLAGMSAAGLYESKVGIPAGDHEALNAAVCDVWASLYTRRAVQSRRQAGVGQLSACMAVLLMELVAPEVSFVLHTARPSDSNTNIIMAELAPGQGETLASGVRGTPWRLEVDKSTSKVDTLAFANFSHALMVRGSGAASTGSSRQSLRYSSFDETQGGKGPTSTTTVAPQGGLVEVEVDYSKQRLSTDSEYREQVGRQLARVGMVIENNFGKEAQDIEGGLVPAEPGSQQLNVVVFQTRPQL